MGRHAYCIIAHQDRYNLETLLKLIDDERNVVYLLPDKKTPSGFSRGLSMHRASLTVIPPEKRIGIRWGGLSQVKAELLLFKEALVGPGFSYLHLLSGADLPIKTQDHIHTFFENTTPGTNFIGFSSGEATEKDIHVKTTFHHLFTERQKLPPDASLADKIIFPAAKLMHHGFLSFQKISGIKRKRRYKDIRKGSNWVSITKEFTSFLVSKENEILKNFKGVICADEIYKQTLAANSSFSDTVYTYEPSNGGGTREIDWNKGNPYVWRTKDYDELENSEALFARKFSSSTDSGIIDMIRDRILKSDSLD